MIHVELSCCLACFLILLGFCALLVKLQITLRGLPEFLTSDLRRRLDADARRQRLEGRCVYTPLLGWERRRLRRWRLGLFFYFFRFFHAQTLTHAGFPSSGLRRGWVIRRRYFPSLPCLLLLFAIASGRSAGWAFLRRCSSGHELGRRWGPVRRG